MEDIAATLLAFANTLPHGHEAILFVGITDAGEIKGLDNPDKTQKSIQRVAATRCYPPVPLQRLVVLEHNQKKVKSASGTRGEMISGAMWMRPGKSSGHHQTNFINGMIGFRASFAGANAPTLPKCTRLKIKDDPRCH